MLKKTFLMLVSLCGLQSLFAEAKIQNVSNTAKNKLINSIVNQIKDTTSCGCKK